MKTVYIIHFETFCEFAAVFDDKFKFIAGWDSNDANWRNEYFSPFMEKLGIKTIDSLPKSVDYYAIERMAYKAVYGSEP